MITMGDLLRIISGDKRITIEVREEGTDALLDWWYGTPVLSDTLLGWWYETPNLLFNAEEIKDIRCAHVKKIRVDSEGEMIISIAFDTEGEGWN